MKFILANPSHDAQLRKLVRSETMPGHIQVAYEREPDFFHGSEIQGAFNQVILAEENGVPLISGCRSIRPMFINGKATDFGYLSGLRSSMAGKRKLGLSSGYKYLKGLHEDGRCPGYITTIISGNDEAFATIAQGRAGLPCYKDLGECRTYAIALEKQRGNPHPDIPVRFARPGEEAMVIQLLNRFGRYHQFFPVLSESDFGQPLLRNLPVTRFLIAEEQGTACGIAAIWDQMAFKQHRIKEYSRPLRLAKPFVNTGLKLAGFCPLPPKGELLKSSFFCFKAAKDNRPDILSALLRQACTHLQQSGMSHCIIGFHADDPAKEMVECHRSTTYRSRLFFTGWKKDLGTFNRLDGRIPSFDPAIL